jgi:hypothetical protein
MRRSRLAALILVAAVLASNRFADPSSIPLAERLQGTWGIVSAEMDGAPDPSQVGGTIVFFGEHVRFAPGPLLLHAEPQSLG